MTQRINARLEPELARKLEALRKHTGQSITEIVTASLESYYVAVTGAKKPARLLADFVACASGSAGLSRTYKADLSKLLARKHHP